MPRFRFVGILVGVTRQVGEWWRERSEMIAFALRWEPFDGGDVGDILVQFGITEGVYYRRLQLILDRASADELDSQSLQRLRRLCQMRLAIPDRRSS